MHLHSFVHFFTRSPSLLVSNPFMLFSCSLPVCCTITVLTRTGQLFLLLFCCNISELCSNFPSFSFSPSFHYFSLFLPHIHLIIVQLFPNNQSRSTSEHYNKRVVDTTLVTQTLADLESNDHGLTMSDDESQAGGNAGGAQAQPQAPTISSVAPKLPPFGPRIPMSGSRRSRHSLTQGISPHRKPSTTM